ncbi:MAG: T9SS type A sorting domain-containing protein [Ignavibacteriae bacterium]|nr:T9SS type A sorting domain-containing protein [Ignavibacteriota bacterium]
MKKIIIPIILVFILNMVCHSQWHPVGPYGGNAGSITSSGSNLAVSLNASGVFTSSNNGNTWVIANNGMTTIYTYSLCYSSNILYAGTNRGIFQSTNNGLFWGQNSLNNKAITSILINSNYIFAGTSDSGIFVSSNNGVNWTPCNAGLTNKSINVLMLCGSYIFAGTHGGVFLSVDNGNSWTPKNWGFCSNPFEITSLAVVGTNVFASSYWGCDVYRTFNYGNNWYGAGTGLPASYYISKLVSDGTNLYAGTTYNAGDYSTGLYISTNNGNFWNNFDNGQISGNISGISISGQNIFTSSLNEWINQNTMGGVFRSTNNGLNWIKSSEGLYNLTLTPIVNIGTYLFTGNKGLYISTNTGTNWSKINSPSVNKQINALSASGTNIYAGTEDSCIFVSSNFGVDWTHIVNNGAPNISHVTALGVSGTNIYAGNNWLYISSNNGNTWRIIDTANLHVSGIQDILVSGTNVFAGFSTGGICRSTNNGLNWVSVNNGFTYPYYYFMSMAKDGQNIYACFYWGKGIFMSTNNGDNWIKISNEITNRNFSTIVAYDSKIFVGADSVIYYSTNLGVNWNSINQGFPAYNYDPLINKLHISNNYIYATTNFKSVWRRLLSDFTGIQKISLEIPSSYSLSQNYPNPFNPSTTIRYDLPRAGVVKLAVYDIMGREVEILVNARQAAGSYEATFDGTRFASGVYFYRLTAEGYGETKRMTLIK